MNDSKPPKIMFKERDYVPFMIGVFALGGFVVLPLFWEFIVGLKNVERDNYYLNILVVSLILCLSIFVAFKRNGTTSKTRAIFAMVIGMFVSSILSVISSQFFSVSNTILSFVMLLMCGFLSVKLYKSVHKQHRSE